MSENIQANFYTIQYMPLAELLGQERTPLVKGELKRRAKEKLGKTYQLYREAFGGDAPECLSEDAANLFIGGQIAKGRA